MKPNALRMSSFGNSLIMVEVWLWSTAEEQYKSINLTVDTGASITTISKNLLYLLGCKFSKERGAMITTASGVEYVDETTIKKLKIGASVLEDVKIYAHTFPEESFSLGVLGLNVLSKYDIELLFSKKIIIFNEIDVE